MSSLIKKNTKEKKIIPLIGTQLAIWIADRLTIHHSTFIVAHFIEIKDEINYNILSKSIVAVMKEADTLNMSFKEINNNPVQWLSPKQFNFPQIINLCNQKNPKKVAYELMSNDMSNDIDIFSKKPLLNQILIHINYKHWYWYQRYHHLLVDGFSFFTITKRIIDFYNALIQNKKPNSTPFISFNKVIDEYEIYKKSSNYINDSIFWKKKCNNLPPLVSLSLNHGNKQNTTINIIHQKISIKCNLIQKIINNISIKNLNIIDIMSSLIALWLARLSGQNNFTVGFACMRRIGSIALCSTAPMVNILPMVINYDPKEIFSKLSCNISDEIEKIKFHQKYDIEQIHNNFKRNIYNNPFFSIIINFKIFEEQFNFNGTEVKTHYLTSGPVHDMEIVIYLNKNKNIIFMELLANPELYSIKNLKQHFSHFLLLLKQVINQPNKSCGSFNLLTKNEKLRFEMINCTDHFIPNITLCDLLKQQIKLTPNNVALIDSKHNLTYIQMNEQVQKLMNLLEIEKIFKKDIIGVALPRSVFLSIALQSIINIGAVYLPLDINYPDERLALMLKDSSPKIIITSNSFSLRFNKINSNIKQLYYDNLLKEKVFVSDKIYNFKFKPSSKDGIYIIYTSGSTGTPKGVIINHESIVNRLLWMQDKYHLNNSDIVLQKTSCSFDVSVWELFWPLISGAKLIFAPSDIYHNPKILKKLFIKYNITIIHFVPSMLSIFIEQIKNDNKYLNNCKSLKKIFCSGESLSNDLAKKWYNITKIKMYNLYGPTEATIDASHYSIFNKKNKLLKCCSVPIGRPVWNTKFKILDANLQPVPPGVLGELYISGIQLAYGYLNKPTITASRFVADPDGNSKRMYRTGDLVRWIDDNDVIEYIRRSDDQVKIRGQRIELNEINQVLDSLPGIYQSITKICIIKNNFIKEENNKQLVSYIIADDNINIDDIKIKLIEKLPTYMVPITIVKLNKFPLNDNGKMNIKCLPIPKINTNNRLPFPGLESLLAKIFCEILNFDKINAKDDFFALGGNSILAMQLISKLRNFTKQPLSIGNVLISSTVEKLAIFIKENNYQKSNIGFEKLLPFRTGGKNNLFCFHPASGFAWQFSALTHYLDQNWSLIGIQSPTIYGPLNKSESFDEICDDHMKTLLEQQPNGPYYFIGYSLGGILAQIIASRLENLGEKINFLGLLDTWPPEIHNWNKKNNEKNILDPYVIEEINRERNQFLSIKYKTISKELKYIFKIIESNYSSSVRLLTTANSLKLNSCVNLFLATKTSQKFNKSIDKAWYPYIKNINIWPLNCNHVEIMSQNIFKQIGPIINKILKKYNLLKN